MLHYYLAGWLRYWQVIKEGRLHGGSKRRQPKDAALRALLQIKIFVIDWGKFGMLSRLSTKAPFYGSASQFLLLPRGFCNRLRALVIGIRGFCNRCSWFL
jgi:hypothetical protein